MISNNMKVLKANPEIPSMTMEEAERFLESKLNLQFATIDDKGDPNIQPVWFYYDKNEEKLFIMTGKKTKRVKISGKDLSFIFVLKMVTVHIKV